MIKSIRLIFGILVLASTNLPAEELVLPFIVKNSCPFEGCTFGEWEVLKNTKVFRNPKSDSPVTGELVVGTKADIVTGLSYVTPGEAIVTGKPYSHEDLIDPKKKIYILDYIGEGYSQIFQNGNFINTKIAREKNQCKETSNWRYCWVKVLRPPIIKWWVQVKGMGWVLMENNPLKPIDALVYKAPYNKRTQPDQQIARRFVGR